MTIGVFTIMLSNGGTERVIAKLSRIWTKEGHKVVFLTESQPEKTDFPHECVAREYASEGDWKIGDADRLKEKYSFDLVVFNGGWNNSWVPPILCRFKELRIRTMVILHHAFNCWAFGGANVGDFSKEQLLSHLDCLVCVDKIQALWWSHRHPCVAYVPNPCGVEIDDVDAGVEKTGNNRIIWVGRATDWGKRINLAMDVFHEVRKNIPNSIMTVVGPLRKGWNCKEAGIEFTGYVQNASAFMQKAAVHLVTTLWEVTVPQVILEARAMGVPTVAFDLPVLRGEDGVYLGKNTVEVSEQIVKVLAEPSKYRIDEKTRLLVGVRNEDASIRWKELFSVFESGELAIYLAKKSREYATVEQYAKLVDEIQRSEKFLAENYMPVLQRIRCWKARWAHLKQMVGL